MGAGVCYSCHRVLRCSGCSGSSRYMVTSYTSRGQKMQGKMPCWYIQVLNQPGRPDFSTVVAKIPAPWWWLEWPLHLWGCCQRPCKAPRQASLWSMKLQSHLTQSRICPPLSHYGSRLGRIETQPCPGYVFFQALEYPPPSWLWRWGYREVTPVKVLSPCVGSVWIKKLHLNTPPTANYHVCSAPAWEELVVYISSYQ